MTPDFMPLPAMESTATAVPPHILLGNHLKTLKLPTFARDYEKVAMESAQDRADITAARCLRPPNTCYDCASSNASTGNGGWLNAL
jgi:hypothetical protein